MPTKKVTTKKPTKPDKPVVEKLPLAMAEGRANPVRGKEPSAPADASQVNRTSNGVEKYYEAVGRRKESSARVRVFTKKSIDVQPAEDKAIITVNGQPYQQYFNADRLQAVVDAPLRKLKSLNRFKATVKVQGGGQHGQADAIKFGLSRALVLFDANFAKKLRKASYLTRDAREKERRKYGLKKARKSPQWSKR